MDERATAEQLRKEAARLRSQSDRLLKLAEALERDEPANDQDDDELVATLTRKGLI